jgi:hypothetical protein
MIMTGAFKERYDGLMTGPSYPPARTVAVRLQERIAANPNAFQDPDAAPRPDSATIEEMISTAFWASLRREEGRAPRISIAFLPPERSVRPLRFEGRFPLEPNVLAHLAPAVERPSIHLGVWSYERQLFVWGITRIVPTWCFVLEVVAPGLVVVKYRRPAPTTKFANVAVLEGADVKFIEQQPAMISEAPPVLGSLFNFYSSAGRNESDNFLIRVATSMRADGRGGTLLVVPKDTNQWQNSIVQPMTYAATPPFPDIDSLIHRDEQTPEVSSAALQSAVDALTGLTAVDGATVISDHFEPLAFGVKIMNREGARRVEEVLLTEPIEGVPDITIDPAQLGGTRHLSAAQFAHDQRNAVALVASQDGRFTVFAWSPVHEIVHAHRLEALLI